MKLSDAKEKFPSDTTGDRSQDLPTSSTVPQPLRHPRPDRDKYRVAEVYRILSTIFSLHVTVENE
jgi:hypothetical protein